MAFEKGHKKMGGRQKGTPNKDSLNAKGIAQKLGCDPFEVLLRMAMGDWQGLGYDKPTRLKSVSQAGDVYEDQITPEMRVMAAKEAAKYVYPQLKAVEHSGEIDGPKIVYEKLSTDDVLKIVDELDRKDAVKRK